MSSLEWREYVARQIAGYAGDCQGKAQRAAALADQGGSTDEIIHLLDMAIAQAKRALNRAHDLNDSLNKDA